MPYQTRRIPPGIIVTGTLFLLTAVPGLLFLIWRSGITQDIAELEKRARKAGEPITLKELATWNKPPPDQDNVLLGLMALWEPEDPNYWKAIHERAQMLPNRKPLDVPSGLPLLGADAGRVPNQLPWTHDQVTLVREFEYTNRSRAEKVRRALLLPRAHFPSTFGIRYSGPIPHLPFLRQESQRLHLRSLLAANDRDGTASLEAIEQILKLAECLREEPSTLSQMVRMAVIGIALNALEPTLTYAALTSAQLERAEQLFGSLNVATALYQAWVGERVLGLRAFDSPLEDLEGRDNPGVGEGFSVDQLASKMTPNRSPMHALGFFSLDQRQLLRTFERLLALNRDGKWENILQSELVIAEAVATADSFPPKILTAITLSGQQRAIRGLLSVEARRRCALLAMAIERYRWEHGGKLPATTEEATTTGRPPAFYDPFDGKPLRYRLQPKGYVVYSVGPDRQDQQGSTVAPAGKADAFDISFTVDKE